MEKPTRFVYVVIPHETYGFGSSDPIVFASEEEADEYISLRTEADELEELRQSYNKYFCMLHDRARREAARKRSEENFKNALAEREERLTREVSDNQCDRTMPMDDEKSPD